LKTKTINNLKIMKTKMSIIALVMGLTIFALAQANPSTSGSGSVAAGTVPSLSETIYHAQPYTNWLYVNTNSPNVSTNLQVSHHWWKQ
jgi:hypothetical protein